MTTSLSRRTMLLGIGAAPLALPAPSFANNLTTSSIAPAAIDRWERFTVINWVESMGGGFCYRHLDGDNDILITRWKRGVRELGPLEPGTWLWGRVDPPHRRHVSEFAPPITCRRLLNLFTILGQHYGRSVSSLLYAADECHHAAMYLAMQHTINRGLSPNAVVMVFGRTLRAATIMCHYWTVNEAMTIGQPRIPSHDRDIAALERKLQAHGYDLS